MKAPDEDPPSFQDSIELNKPMPVREVIERLAAFYNATTDDVLQYFPKLKDFEGTVKFGKDNYRGLPCITMEGFETGKNYTWQYNLRPISGALIPIIG